ncbi:unnamed protein product [Haemonchus placei]|uniref:Odorant receptor n=1 Tax=Haemonchus placei TaxID=6290 RepID=A0A0N4WTV9_HAEPC|nr:unnamed protein product [Haemonchus placei]
MDESRDLNFNATIKLPLKATNPKILGPFEVVLRCCALDLSHCSGRKDGWTQSIIRIVVCAAICLTMLLVCIILAMEDSKPMTLEWAVGCVMCFMAMHGFGSALCIVSWTRSGFLGRLEESLAGVRAQLGPSDGNRKMLGVYGRMAVGALVLITTWFLSAMKGILYEGVQSTGSAPFTIGYPVNLSTMYGAAPLIYLAFGIYSSLALIVYTLIFTNINREWTSFNDDLVESARLQQLRIPAIFENYLSRQSELIRLVKFVNQHMTTFVSMSAALAALTSAVGLYWMTGVGDEVSILMRVISCLWMNTGIVLILTTLQQPAQTQLQIDRTVQVLLADDFCHHSADDQIWKITQNMVDRARYSSTMMYFLQAFAIDQHFGHKVLVIAPNLGTLLVLIKKMGLI